MCVGVCGCVCVCACVCACVTVCMSVCSLFLGNPNVNEPYLFVQVV